ncbi:hybrid sensor histidine kinase/response regulator [Aliiglaciecola sp. LCG003]|uniref:hybrid sensor histidine kinase/response regulator n=1 Tax=Aliiglaciecola sp. LCG003 TaxID=3053655 RepID=UPI002572FA72|nr:hybrid sensor histidine kinase/response regulator [Aliiglaciecola sp. LCG003]WJG09993.1 7TM diverse intracellular signaling domain-containing protein [Aliiglaciecola sp. LCG003]
MSLTLVLLSLCQFALAQSTLQLINKNEIIRLSQKVQILQETNEQLHIDQVRKKLDEFKWQSSSNPNYGIQNKGIWLHTSFSNVSDAEEWVIDIGFPHIEKVDFYLLHGKTLIAADKQGKLSQNQSSRFPSIRVDLPYATTIDLFIRLESHSTQIIAPIDIQPFSQYVLSSFWDNLLWGLFYGGLLILAVYNLVLYFGSKEKSLLGYVGYICAVLLWQFIWGGHATMLLPYGLTLWISQHMDLIFVIIGIASGLFTYTFLDAKHTAPKISPFIKINILLLGVMGFCSLINLFPVLSQNTLVYLISMFAILSYLAAGVESYLNKFRPARYFVLAWGVLALSAVIGMLSLTGIFPSNTFTTYCFQVGVFIEAGLFSIAILDKSRNQLEQDIQQATNDLRNNMEFIEEQNVRLDIARKDAISASNIKSQFLANMSHEIRTPLNAILGFSKELVNTPLPPDKQEHVRIINSAADSLLSIVNDVLDVSKIEAGKLQLNRLPFLPNDILEELVSVMARSAHLKQLEFYFELSPLPEKLIGDAQRIKQILTNLLGNALKFTPKGSISLAVTGKALEHDLFELNFRIEDTGIGISKHDRKKLFNAFSQIDDAISRSYQGTGLGLVICQQLVRLMGGRIQLDSQPGEGSCFIVRIMTTVLNKNESFSRNIGWNKRQVLVYQTEPKSTLSTIQMLNNVGAEVTKVEKFSELNRLKHKFDSVFVCLPQNGDANQDELYNDLAKLKMQDLVIMYSGPESDVYSHRSESIRHLRLPLTLSKLASLTEQPIETKHDQVQQDLLSLPKAKVLAVDDMEMNLRLLRTWLKPTRLELTLAFSGEEAVSLCQQNEYDLILMDVQMPNMDGLQASRLIRKTELNLGTPIIALTAHALKEEQERLLASGMDDYLPKPLDLCDLVTLIKRWCALSDPSAQELSSIDWSLALQRANQNAEAAQDVLQDFIQQLPAQVEEIRVSWHDSDRESLAALIHKLHGACCYTGVPLLLALCKELETALKTEDYDLVDQRMADFFDETESVIAVGIDFQ